MANCLQCGKLLDENEIGLYKKMVDRGAETFMCKQCLSVYLGVSVPLLNQKIIQFQKMGCMLFPPYDPNSKEAREAEAGT